MSDDLNPAQEPSEPTYEYVETVVEYVDNKRQRVVLGLVLVLLFVLLLGLSFLVLRLSHGTNPPAAEDVPDGITWVRSIYGWGNKPEQALVTPTDVAIGPDGTIWCTSNHEAIVGFNPDGTLKKLLQPKGTASIEGLAIDEKGNIFAADYGGQILEITPEGSVVDTWMVELPSEIDVRDGKIAVAGAGGIAVFTPDGEVLLQMGSRGSGDDQFDLPHGILIGDDGTIYVSDTQNRRVRAFSPQGRLLWSNGTAVNREAGEVVDNRDKKNDKLPFELPSGLTMNGKGQLVLADPFKFQIIVLDAKTGKIAKQSGSDGLPATFGDFGTNDGLFVYPTGVAYDKSRDWFAVADTGANRVQIIRLPNSGGSALAPIVRSFRLPMCVFAIPLLLLAIAVGALISRRRREREVDAAA